MDNPILQRVKEVLKDKKAKNPRFGLRALARQLKLPAPTLSRILNGRSGLTLDMAWRMVRGLTEDPAEQRRLLKAHALEPGQVPAKPTRYRYLSLKELDRLSHWGHSAILEVLAGEQGIRSIATIARATGLTDDVAEACLKDLQALKLVDRSIKRGWYTKGHHLSSVRWEGEKAWLKIHRGYLEQALRYTERYRSEDATVQGITFRLLPDQIADARRRIQEFAEELADEIASESAGPLYRLNIQLFPLGEKDQLLPIL